MASVSSLTVNAWRGSILGEQKGVEIITRAGVAGTGILVGAYQATRSVIETEYYGTLANCQTWVNTAVTYTGNSISVTDALGTTWSDTVVLSVTYKIQAVKGLGANTHIVFATWEMMAEV